MTCRAPSSAATLTAYIGGIEEVQTTCSTTQATTSYAVGRMGIAAAVNGTFSYFGYDALGSQVLVFNASGSVVGVWWESSCSGPMEPALQHGNAADQYRVYGPAWR